MKPVAWMHKAGESHYLSWTKEPNMDKSIPLYTAPRELSDEEIMKEAKNSCLTAWIAINPMLDVERQKETAKQRMVEFARAILKKASEK